MQGAAFPPRPKGRSFHAEYLMNLKHRIASIMVCGALLSPAWMARGGPPPPATAPAAARAANTSPAAGNAAAADAPAPPVAAGDARSGELKTLDQEVQGL